MGVCFLTNFVVSIIELVIEARYDSIVDLVVGAKYATNEFKHLIMNYKMEKIHKNIVLYLA